MGTVSPPRGLVCDLRGNRLCDLSYFPTVFRYSNSKFPSLLTPYLGPPPPPADEQIPHLLSHLSRLDVTRPRTPPPACPARLKPEHERACVCALDSVQNSGMLDMTFLCSQDATIDHNDLSTYCVPGSLYVLSKSLTLFSFCATKLRLGVLG